MPEIFTSPLKQNTLEAALPWFARLTLDAQAQLLDEIETLELEGGAQLFAQGDASDAFYAVMTGSFGAFRKDSDGNQKLIGRIAANECAGEMGMLSGEPRGATVRALRDSAVLKLSRSTFERLVAVHPEALLGISRQAILRASKPADDHRGMPRTFAILSGDASINLREFAESWMLALKKYGDVVLLSSESAYQDASWFHELESRTPFVIYLADGNQSDWYARCIRQADACLNLAHPESSVMDLPPDQKFSNIELGSPHHYLLMHRQKPRLGAARRFLKNAPFARLHHVRDHRDVAQIVRLLLGKSMNLVLSGGGARGFAHIGVVKALREAGIEIDAVGGTSIGAMVGAAVAADWSIEEMTEVFRRAFVSTNPLSDYTLPLVSLVAGRKVSRLLRESFGERDIEDLSKPFFAVSANLTRGIAQVHERGPLWLALRASVSIPGLLPPVCQNGEVLVDGGVIDNLPVSLMRQRQQGEVIAVDIGGDHAVRAVRDEFELPSGWLLLHEWFGKSARPRLRDILLRAGMLNASAMTQAARAQSSLLIRPELADIGLLEWKAFDRAIAAGYHHTLRVVGGSKDALTSETVLLS